MKRAELLSLVREYFKVANDDEAAEVLAAALRTYDPHVQDSFTELMVIARLESTKALFGRTFGL